QVWICRSALPRPWRRDGCRVPGEEGGLTRCELGSCMGRHRLFPGGGGVPDSSPAHRNHKSSVPRGYWRNMKCVLSLGKKTSRQTRPPSSGSALLLLLQQALQLRVAALLMRFLV